MFQFLALSPCFNLYLIEFRVKIKVGSTTFQFDYNDTDVTLCFLRLFLPCFLHSVYSDSSITSDFVDTNATATILQKSSERIYKRNQKIIYPKYITL